MPPLPTDALLRREDARLLCGAGQFIADLAPPGLLHAVFVRSMQAGGRVTALHTDAARSLPGVVAVFTEADLPGMARRRLTSRRRAGLTRPPRWPRSAGPAAPCPRAHPQPGCASACPAWPRRRWSRAPR